MEAPDEKWQAYWDLHVMAAVRLVSSVILTRLLDVKSFGIMGFLSTINIIFVQMTDLGFFPYVVRQANETEEMLDEVWTLRLLRSVVITGVIIALSPILAAYVQQPDLVPAIIISSLVVVIDGFSSMTFATAARRGATGRSSGATTAACSGRTRASRCTTG